jgi:hypothetical protein
MSRIRLSLARDERPPNMFADFEWASEQRIELLAQYGECVLLVYQKQVIGQGDTIEAAESDAERRLPPEASEITPIIHFSSYRNRIHRVLSRKNT